MSWNGSQCLQGARRISKLVAMIWIIVWIVKSLNGNMGGDPITFVSAVFGGLLFILVITWAIGWTVRSFMDIPKGQDQRKQ